MSEISIRFDSNKKRLWWPHVVCDKMAAERNGAHISVRLRSAGETARNQVYWCRMRHDGRPRRPTFDVVSDDSPLAFHTKSSGSTLAQMSLWVVWRKSLNFWKNSIFSGWEICDICSLYLLKCRDGTFGDVVLLFSLDFWVKKVGKRELCQSSIWETPIIQRRLYCTP